MSEPIPPLLPGVVARALSKTERSMLLGPRRYGSQWRKSQWCSTFVNLGLVTPPTVKDDEAHYTPLGEAVVSELRRHFSATSMPANEVKP